MEKLFRRFTQYFALSTLLFTGVACGDTPDDPTPPPPPPVTEYDLDFKMTQALGSLHSEVLPGGISNFFIVMSDGQLGGTAEKPEMLSQGNVVIFDLYAVSKEVLPAGTYPLIRAETPTPPEASIDWSGYVIDHPVGMVNTKALSRFADGDIVVTVNGSNFTIEAIGTDSDGSTYRCTYTGPIEFKDEGGAIELPPIEEDITTTFKYGNADYFGLDKESGAAHFGLSLADYDVLSEVDGVRVVLDLYADPDAAPTAITAGRYTVVDAKTPGSLLPGAFHISTMMSSGCYAEQMSPKEDNPEDFKVLYGFMVSGSVDIAVSGDEYTISVNLVDKNGHKVVGTYKGVVPIRDRSYASQLKEDIVVDLEGMPAGNYYYGDWYEVNANNWVVLIGTEADNTDAMQIDLVCPLGSFEDGLPAGEYKVTKSNTYEPGTYVCMPGLLIGAELHYTWFLGDMYQGIAYTEAPATDGSIIITRSGDTYTYTFEFWDDAPEKHKFSGTWTGEPKNINGLLQQAPARVQRAAERPAQPQMTTVTSLLKPAVRTFPRQR